MSKGSPGKDFTEALVMSLAFTVEDESVVSHLSLIVPALGGEIYESTRGHHTISEAARFLQAAMAHWVEAGGMGMTHFVEQTPEKDPL
jgi:hypothetical protein